MIPNSTPTSQTRPDYDPFEHASRLGLQVIYRPIRTANELWLPDHDTIVIKQGMRAVHQRTSCAHGVAHALLGHRDDRPKHEGQADRLAALHMIDRERFTDLLRYADLPTISRELGVTERLLRAYLSVDLLAG